MNPDILKRLQQTYPNRPELMALFEEGFALSNEDLKKAWDEAQNELKKFTWKIDMGDEYCNRWYEVRVDKNSGLKILAGIAAYGIMASKGEIAPPSVISPAAIEARISRGSGTAPPVIRSAEENKSGEMIIKISAGSMSALWKLIPDMPLNHDNNDKIGHTY